MKKLIFAAVAALAMVSVSSVFASVNNVEKAQYTAPADTTDTPAPSDTAQTPAPAEPAPAE